MKIIADKDIPFVASAFASMGAVTLVPDREITAAVVADADMLLVRTTVKVDKELLEESSVKFVGSPTAGIDHVDTGWLSENMIGFAHAPGCNAQAVCEYVGSALVSVFKSLNRPLAGSTIAIIGAGNVGSRVMRLCTALGMQCLVCDPPKYALTKNTIYQPLEKILGLADVVSVHVPLINSGEYATAKMVNDSFLQSMKKGSILINTCRGGVVDEAAVLRHRTKLSALVADVWEHEPLINPDYLAATTLATPHIAGYSYEGKLRGTVMIREAVNAFYFKKERWELPADSHSVDRQSITVGLTDDAVDQVLTAACPLELIDKKFRTITALSTIEQIAYFGTMRREALKRHECSFYRITGSGSMVERNAALLRELNGNA